MESITKRTELITKYMHTQEILYRIRLEAKMYYEKVSIFGVPIWFLASGSDFERMLSKHFKEAMDYTTVGQILIKLESQKVSFLNKYDFIAF